MKHYTRIANDRGNMAVHKFYKTRFNFYYNDVNLLLLQLLLFGSFVCLIRTNANIKPEKFIEPNGKTPNSSNVCSM